MIRKLDIAEPQRQSSTTMQSPPVLTMAEVAALCGVGIRAIERYIVGNDPLPFRTIGKQLRVVFPDDLVAFAKRRGMLLLGDPVEVARPWPRLEPAGEGSAA